MKLIGLNKKTKEQIYREAFSLMTVGVIPNDIFDGYINDIDGSGASEMQVWCVENMKDDISDWCTGIGIIEAVEHLYITALENGNI